jgi:beta-lactamase superfamily II metal-dependent hydrolase
MLKAGHGDCLLLHYGAEQAPKLMLVDGGPSGVYRRYLRPRLEELRRMRAPDDALRIELAVVSHSDEAHLHGILDLINEVLSRQEEFRPPLFRIARVWHNSWDELVGEHWEEFLKSAAMEIGAASIGAEVPMVGLSLGASLMLASVPLGRSLREGCARLGLNVNAPVRGLLTSAAGRIPIGDGVTLTVLSPSRERILQEQAQWDAMIRKRGLEVEAGLAGAASLADSSAYRSASLVLLVESAGKRVLLPGDARGDDILQAIDRAGLLARDGHAHFDLLKVPGHGSSGNVDLDFFQRITADHYVIFADGKYGNPEPAVFETILKARGNEPFSLHLSHSPEDFVSSYPVAKLRRLVNAADARLNLRSIPREKSSLTIDLLRPGAD